MFRYFIMFILIILLGYLYEKYKYKIGVLDFGIVYEIENKYKTTMFEIIIEMFNSPPIITAEKFF